MRVQDNLYIRDYDKCVLCYRCVEACGDDAQHTYAISVAGRGFGARISTEFDVTLPDSACVYCGNCVAVCPTNALQFKTEFETFGKPTTGAPKTKPSPKPCAPTAAWAATWNSTCKTTKSSNAPPPTTTT